MNNNYLYDYVQPFERILSFAYKNKYSYEMVEHVISHSSFFQRIESDKNNYPPIVDELSLIKDLFNTSTIDLTELPSYNQCSWAAESYLRIQDKTKLTFEAIFLFIPIKKMFEYFSLFHEMDFTQIVDEFNRLYAQNSVLELLLVKYNYSLKYISQKIGLPYDTLFSYKQRRRDIKKMSAESAVMLANIFRVRVETLLELKI